MFVSANKEFYNLLRQEVQAASPQSDVYPRSHNDVLPDVYVRELERYQHMIEGLQNEKAELNAKILVLSNSLAEIQNKKTDNSQDQSKDEQKSFTVQDLVAYAISKPTYDVAKPIEDMLNILCRGCNESVYKLIDSIEDFFRKQKEAVLSVSVQPGAHANIGCDQRGSEFKITPGESTPPQIK